jgi:hypothetical protein
MTLSGQQPCPLWALINPKPFFPFLASLRCFSLLTPKHIHINSLQPSSVLCPPHIQLLSLRSHVCTTTPLKGIPSHSSPISDQFSLVLWKSQWEQESCHQVPLCFSVLFATCCDSCQLAADFLLGLLFQPLKCWLTFNGLYSYIPEDTVLHNHWCKTLH